MKGTIIAGKYELTAELGSGGMGAVYAATHLTTRGRFAIKVILDTKADDREPFERFKREAVAAATIESRHVARVFDVGLDEATDTPFMVMELFDGTDLQRLLSKENLLRESVVREIALQTCLGLAAAHRAGVVHRDIKPANIFLARQDAGELCVKVLDFGIAKMLQSDLASTTGNVLTQTGTMIGSPHYMSPEQARGAKTLDARSDIWSLGVTLYRMVAGAMPHDPGTLGELILAICSSPVKPLREVAPWVSPGFAAVIHRALERNTAQRFQTMDEMAEAIRAVSLYAYSPGIHARDLLAPSQGELSSMPRFAGAPVVHEANTLRDPTRYGSTTQGLVFADLHAPRPVTARTSSQAPIWIVAAAGLTLAGVGLAFVPRALQHRAAASTEGSADSRSPVSQSSPAPIPVTAPVVAALDPLAPVTTPVSEQQRIDEGKMLRPRPVTTPPTTPAPLATVRRPDGSVAPATPTPAAVAPVNPAPAASTALRELDYEKLKSEFARVVAEAEANCVTPAAPVSCQVTVAFEPTGNVRVSTSSVPQRGTPEMECAFRYFRTIRVGAFEGKERVEARTATLRRLPPR